MATLVVLVSLVKEIMQDSDAVIDNELLKSLAVIVCANMQDCVINYLAGMVVIGNISVNLIVDGNGVQLSLIMNRIKDLVVYINVTITVNLDIMNLNLGIKLNMNSTVKAINIDY